LASLPEKDRRSPTPLWRLETLDFKPLADEDLAEAEAEAEARALSSGPTLAREHIGRDANAKQPPPPPPIVPWSRLRRVTESICGELRATGEVDVEALVAQLGRAEPIMRLPRGARRVQARRLVVIIDRADRLIPFWRDQLEVYFRLEQELGRRGLGCAWWTEGPPLWRRDAEAVAAVAPELGEGDVVLALSDLGLHGAATTRHRWLRLGAALGRRGIATTALVPCPRSRWHASELRPWLPIDWASPSGPSPAPARQTERRDELLLLLSWTVRTEPALLRDVRSCLPATAFDIGTEADVWNHPEVARHPSGLMYSVELRRTLQQQLLARMRVAKSEDDGDRERLLAVIDRVRRRHAALPREIWLEELQILESLDPEGGWVTAQEREQVEVFAARVQGAIRARADLGDEVDLRGWARRSLVMRMPEQAWADARWGEGLHEVLLAVSADDSRLQLPPGVDVGKLQPRGERMPPLVDWVVSQVGGQLHIGRGRVGVAGSYMLTIPARSPWLWVSGAADEQATGYALGRVERVCVPAGAALRLETDCASAQLRLQTMPSWTHAMGRDRYGLWAAFRVHEVEQRMRWIPPGRFMMGSPADEKGRYEDEGPQHLVTIAQGFWMAETPCTQALWEAVMGDNPSRFKSPDSGKRPVESVSWDDVQPFIAELEKQLKDPQTNESFGLPSEEQWEYACRAGTTTPRYGELDAVAWYDGNSNQKTHDVGLKQRNPWGLYDMLGNVHEWSADKRAPYQARTSAESPSPSGQDRVLRGGSWHVEPRYVRAAFRSWGGPGLRLDRLGFRLVRGQGLRQQEQEEQGESKGSKPGAGDPPGGGPASPRKGKGR